MDRPWRNDALWLDVLLALVLWAIGQFAASRDIFQFGTGLNVVKSTLYSNEAVIFAATLGFLIAGTAIIASSTNLNRIKTGFYPVFKVLAQTFRDSMYCAGLGIAFAFVAPIFDRSSDNAATAVIAVVVFFLVTARTLRAARRLYLTLLI